MKRLKKDLQGVTREFNSLTEKAKKLMDEAKKRVADQMGQERTAVISEIAARKTAEALKTLTKTMGTIAKAVEKYEKAQAAAKKKATAKPKKTTKTPTRKKAPKPTATDQVVKIIERSQKGVDVPEGKENEGKSDKTPSGSPSASGSKPDVYHGRKKGHVAHLVGIQTFWFAMGLDGLKRMRVGQGSEKKNQAQPYSDHKAGPRTGGRLLFPHGDAFFHLSP